MARWIWTVERFKARMTATQDIWDASLVESVNGAHGRVGPVVCNTCGHHHYSTINDLVTKKSGCPSCSGQLPMTQELFQSKMAMINPTLNISKAIVRGSKTPMNISCMICGYSFKAAINNLIYHGTGCGKCAKNIPWTLSELIKAVATTKPTLDLSGLRTIKSDRKGHIGPIGCTVCGNIFTAAVNTLVNRIGGCRTCGKHASPLCTQWLDSLGLPNLSTHREVRGLIEGKRFIADGYDPTINTVYEFHGSYWHGDPELYASYEVNATTGKTFGELNELTKLKHQIFIDAGFNYIEMWESEWKRVSNHG